MTAIEALTAAVRQLHAAHTAFGQQQPPIPLEPPPPAIIEQGGGEDDDEGQPDALAPLS